MKRYASICCKEAKGISHGAIPVLAVRLTILIVIVLLVACGDGSSSSPNPDVPIPESSNANLVDLLFHGSLDQPFSTDRFDYTATVAYRFKSIQVTPVTADENANVTINGSDIRSGFASPQIDLSVGQNAPILVEVTAEDGKASKTYRLVVTVEAPSTNADLASIGISTGALDPVFDATITAYAVSVDFSTTTVQLSPKTRHPGATVTVDGVPLPINQITDPILLALGDNSITLQVTAEDGVSTKNYNLVVTRDLGDNANLSDLSISPGVLNSIFQPFIADYSASVGFIDTTIRVTATTESAVASVFVNNIAAVSGAASQPVPLGEGGNLVNITVRAEDGITTQNYSVLVERQSTNAFVQQAYLKASNTGTSDQFASSVALSGDTLAVGAAFEDSNANGVNSDESNNLAADSGAVYVFTRDVNDQWSQQAYLKASNTRSDDRFASSVALSGNTLAVGAPDEDSNAIGINGDERNILARESGAVYVFTRDSGNQWAQQAYVKASNTDSRDFFGISIALSGDTLAVGAAFEDSNATGVNGDESNRSSASGAVYVYTRDSNNQWSQQAYIKASNTEVIDYFGSKVSLSGDILAVSAYGEDSNATGINGDDSNNSAIFAGRFFSTGAVYVYTRDISDQWSQQAYIKASNTGSGDNFGSSVALSGDTLAVGARREDSNATGVNGNQANNGLFDSGAVYVFQ